MRIIFQDIDGPLIPYRMYFNGTRPFDIQRGSFIYDPIAVGMLNKACNDLGAQIVFSSAHNENGNERMTHQAKVNNIQYLHTNAVTIYPGTHSSNISRLDGIKHWLQSNPGVTDWIVIDDLLVHPPKQILIDYEIGMTMQDFYKIYELFGVNTNKIYGIGHSKNGKLL